MDQLVPRRTGEQEDALLELLTRSRRASVSLEADRELLEAVTAQPEQLLSRMRRKGLLHSLGAGRYVIAPRGTDRIEQAVPRGLIVDAWMRGRGPYYVGFLSALIEHRLTDLHQNEIQVAVPATFTPAWTTREVRDVRLRITRLRGEHRWFGVERKRVERLGAYSRSNLARTMVDTLHRPRLCASQEVIGVAWGRWARRDDCDPEEVARYAGRLGDSVARRCGYLLSLVGHEGVATQVLAEHLGKSGRVLFDASDSYGLPPSEWRWDARWGLTLNVPEGHLRSWVGAEQ